MSFKNQGRNWASPAKRARIYARDGYRCLYCNGKLGDPDIAFLTLDHVDPCYQQVDRNRDSNLVSSCRSCNSAKGAKSLDAFMRYIAVSGWMPGAAKRIRYRIQHAISSDTATRNMLK